MLASDRKFWYTLHVTKRQVMRWCFIILLGLTLYSLGLAGQPDSLKPEVLKQSDWWQTVQQNIGQMEYEVSWQEQCMIPGGKPGYHMVNRAQNLRAYFYPERLKIMQRSETKPSWVWSYELTGFGRQGTLQPMAEPKLAVEQNRIEYHHEALVARYENRESAIKQTFIINRSPAGSRPLLLVARLSGDLNPQLTDDHSVVEFLHNSAVVLRYGGLQVTDANGGELPAQLSLTDDQLHIIINDAKAIYPLTIDPSITGADKFGLPDTPDWTAESDQVDARLGYSVSTAGDVNGDGYSDVIVGAYFFDNGQTDEGLALLYYGSASGLSASANWSDEGNQAEAHFGDSVATAGDVNGDGYSDVIIGAPLYDAEETNEGRVFVYHGSAMGLSSSDWTADECDQTNANFGSSVATAGDVNRDGYSDVIIGAPLASGIVTGAGATFVYRGSASGLSAAADWTALGDQFYSQFGQSVATAGDINGDGYSEIIIGAPFYDNGQTDEGQVYVYYGSASGPSTTPDWTAESNQDDAWFGRSVSTAGDVNGDGYADIIVGAYYYDNGQSNEGAAFVWFGWETGLGPDGTPANADWTAEGNQDSAGFGCSVSTAGDVNGDGRADIIIGAYQYDNGQTDEGRVYVYYGGPPYGLSTSPDWTAESNQPNPWFGWSVSTAGDVNGDGYSDIIVGAYMYYNGQAHEGAAFVYHGSGSGLSTAANWAAHPGQDQAEFGFSVSTAGDVNGDGYADVIIGAIRFDNGQTDEGAAFVHNGWSGGISGFPSWTAESDQANAHFGRSVSTAGDVNGDGYDDVIVGAYLYNNGQADEGRAYLYQGSASGLNSSPSWTAEGNQDYARFGVSVDTAGDVNGDGYSDGIIGAHSFDNGETDEGQAFVYHGSASGLNTSPNWTAESNQASAYFGWSVSSAGDVNGDGYSDVIIGAYLFSNGDAQEGRAFLYHGSGSGLSTSPNWTAESNQISAQFGYSVSTAGDVNGDGYSDVIVGAPLYNNGYNDEGRVFSYHGSGSGLNTSPNWADEGNQALAYFGWSVSTAGDVNGDGYADAIVGARQYNNGETDEGAAFIYYGSGVGLNATVKSTIESNQASADFGCSVATAGDVNGDGYADVIVGARLYDLTHTDEGRAFVYCGNGDWGTSLNPRQHRSDDSAPIAHLGKSNSGSAFRLKLLGRSPFGRGKVKLQTEVKPLGTSFDGTGTQQSTAWMDTGTAGVELNQLVSSLSPGTVYHWRVRLLYQPAVTPLQQFSRWLTMPWNGWQEADLRTAMVIPTPTPTPTGCVPIPIDTWTFEPPPAGWSYHTAAPPADIPAWSHASSAQVTGPGALGITAPAGETTNYYGSWDNYSGDPGVPAISWVDNSAWRAMFTMSTDKSDPNTVPSIRLRLAENHMKATSYIQLLPGDWVPIAERGVGTTDYNLYLRPPIVDNGFFLAFDLIDFGQPFGVPCNGTLYLEEVAVDRFDLTDPCFDNYWTDVITYSGTGLHSWTHSTAGVTYLTDVNGYSQPSAGLEQNTTTAQTRAFGAWTSPADEVDLIANQFYRGVWTLACEDSSLGGAERIRMHTVDFRLSSYMVIDRDADTANSALPPTTGKDYYIYADFPGTPSVDKLLLAWDLFDFDPNAGGWARLTDVIVSRRDMP